tara:strand:- start:2043 stop:3731 length:1689 start_codon:yes stop_codon:yes gene_type:complete
MKWKLRTSFPQDNQVNQIMKAIDVQYEIAYLLVTRGVKDYDSAKRYFRPNKDDLHDPFIMLDMIKAVERIHKAIHNQEKIMIFGDYDVDGTTAVTLVYSYLKDYLPIIYYIPDRYSEGYGVSKKSIDIAKKEKVSLIISLDCGINAIDNISYAKKNKIDFIVCDHHIPGKKKPDAIAILNPKQTGCNYPFKELSGCGIGFKLIHALEEKRSGNIKDISHLFDLVAMSIAADMVELTDENRIMAFYGIKQIQESPRQGIKIFLKDIKGKINISHLVFTLAPRINASGRMKHAKHSVELLLSQDKSEAIPRGRLIEMLNSERRILDNKTTLEAIDQIKKNGEEEFHTSVVYKKDWNKGIIGIVASRMIETYYRPTVVFTSSGEYLTGSVRSIKGIDIYDILHSCKKHIHRFGGHKYAAGLTIIEDSFLKFKSAFELAVKERTTAENNIPIKNYDQELTFDKITPKFYRILVQMSPFGEGNPEPVFKTVKCLDSGGTKIVGKLNDHLKLELIDALGNRFKGIGFKMAEHYENIKNQVPFNVFYNINMNDFLGEKELQLNIKGIEF